MFNDNLPSAFCQTQLDTYGLNDLGQPVACYGDGTEVEGVVQGMCPTCSNPGFCDYTCGCWGTNQPSAAPSLMPSPMPIIGTSEPSISSAPSEMPSSTPTSAPSEAPILPAEPPLFSDWILIAAPLVFLFFFGFTILGFCTRNKNQTTDRASRSIVACISAITISGVLIFGQACKSFAVSYKVGVVEGTELEYDFYGGERV